ncbi:MAG: glycosyl hydrolase, partial [Proteobacteria bacterium]
FNVLLAGSVNLIREPRNGRNFEYAGEDPLLAGVIAGAQVDGIQSNRMISTIKHFALNAQETDRNSSNAVLGEADMRMSDLLAFQIALERGNPGSVMCAYNKVNGPHACESEFLLTQVLRRDWNWPGYVMSDWGAVHSTAIAANAGLEQESGFGLQRADHFGQKLATAVEQGEVSPTRIDEMATRILHAMFEHGLVDDPATDGHPIDFVANQAISRQAAEAGAVLLKNHGDILPLASTVTRIAVIGGHADKGVLSGGGSSQVYPGDGPDGGNAVPGIAPVTWPGPVVYYPSSPLDELRKALPGVQIDYADGSDPAAAAALAAQADLAIVFGTQWASESIDVKLALDGDQDALVEAVAMANPQTVVVLQTGGPVLMPWEPKVQAILEVWYPGRAGGQAIANLLTGKVNPSGRLPVTFPASLSQLPYPGEPRKGEIAYSEGAAAGYKWLDKTNAEPLYPFGHGLSYTRFGIDELELELGQDGAANLNATVTYSNYGERPGAGVVQIYARHDGWEAPQRLVAFTKGQLAPNETLTTKLAIDPRLLAVWDTDLNSWVVQSGDYTLSASYSSRHAEGTASFRQEKMLVFPAGWRPAAGR